MTFSYQNEKQMQFHFFNLCSAKNSRCCQRCRFDKKNVQLARLNLIISTTNRLLLEVVLTGSDTCRNSIGHVVGIAGAIIP